MNPIGEGLANASELTNDIKVVRTAIGGFVVFWDDRLIGWMHASIGDKWNAHSCGLTPSDHDEFLGRFTKKEATRRIASAAGWSNQV